MSALSIQPPFPIFTDTDGSPLENGYVWLGTANQDPQANPITAYWDAALTITAAQPIRTIGGYPANNGTPARLYVAEDYSIRVQNKNGSQVYSAPEATEAYGGGIINASVVVYDPAGLGAVPTTVQAKLRETVSVKDFGAVGDGVTDDTAAIQDALNAAKHVVVPAGMTPLISASITVPSRTRLEFLGGTGNLISAMPASYLIKKSTMTTPGILIEQRGIVTGGGLLCQPGNTGDGVQLLANAAVLSEFVVVGAGRDGVRVGVDGVYRNTNSTIVEYVKARENGRHGIYVHDGVSVGPADANAGTLLQCTAIDNGGDGIRIGHAFWVSIINCLTEINDGWGLYLSGDNNDSYPECRWTTIVGGDYNEGNVTGQVYDGSYFALFLQPDTTSVATTAVTGLQGGGRRSAITASGVSTLQGLNVETNAAGPGSRPLVANAGSSGGTVYPSVIRQRTTASNNDGPGLKFQVDPATGVYRDAGAVRVSQRTTNYDNTVFSININGVLTDVLLLSGFTNEKAVCPAVDNTYSSGRNNLRWTYDFIAPRTVASLTAAATAGAGARTFVSDANATTFASVVAGGGANVVPVYSDGTNWRIG